jgi:anti-sigma-K factor RskA
MTAEPCRGRRGDVAAYALGRLSPDDATRTLAHLDGCPTCRDALAELRSTAALLPLADPQRIDSQPVPPPDLGERIQKRVLEDRRAQRARATRRRFTTAIAAAAAILALAIAAVFIVGPDDDPSLQTFAEAAPGVSGAFSLEANEQGTAVIFEHRGLDPDEIYWLWLTDDSGRRMSAGTFQGAQSTTRVTLQSALPEDEAVRIWVTDTADDVVLDSQIAQ